MDNYARLAEYHAKAALDCAKAGRFPNIEKVNRELVEFYMVKAQRARQRHHNDD